ncbi:MAG: hypothetical protein ACPGAJ_02635 [Schleiferiaceae bacterium]
MKKLLIMAFVVLMKSTLAQQFNKINQGQALNLEGAIGSTLSDFGFSYSNTNFGLKVGVLSNIYDSTTNSQHWIGLEKSLYSNTRSPHRIILSIGMLSESNESLEYDVSSKISYQYEILEGLRIQTAILHAFPEKFMDAHLFNFSAGVSYGIPIEANRNGIYRNKKKRLELSAIYSFGSELTSLGVDWSQKGSLIGGNFSFWTDQLTIFNSVNDLDFQTLSLTRKVKFSNEVYLLCETGLIGKVQQGDIANDGFAGLSLHVRIYDNIGFRVRAIQGTKPHINERIQPIVHAGLSLNL